MIPKQALELVEPNRKDQSKKMFDQGDPGAPINLLGLPYRKMQDFLTSIGEQPFRAQQIMKWIHTFKIVDFDQMTNLSKALRHKLQQCAIIKPPTILSLKTAHDGVLKWIIEVASGSKVECVFIPERSRGTLCVSSQAGCMLDCTFCSTGKQGFDSNLSAAEIIGQVWLASLALSGKVDENGNPIKITNVVMMGMGEPLLNFDPVVDSMNIMMDDWGYGLSKRRVTVSTSGVVPALYKLAEVSEVSLAVSLHAPNDELRNKLVPLNKKYPIHILLKAIEHYMNALPDKKRVVTFEYTLIYNVNDLVEHAKELAKLLKNVPCKINLIPFNPFSGSNFVRSSNNHIDKFQKTLREAGFNVTVRKTRGDGIDAACGQLVGQVQDRTKRQERYISALQIN